MADTSTLSIPTDDGAVLSGYLVRPDRSPKGVIIVLQELFGVNRHIRNVCDGFALDGYVAIAPGLFDRVRPGIELGYAAEDVQVGLACRDSVPVDRVVADIQSTIDLARVHGPVFAVGYCWGGTLAFLAAARLTGLTAAAGYYGSMIPDFCDEAPKVPLMLHFGAEDHTLPPERVARIEQARPEAAIHIYDAGHGFNCDERASFDEASAAVARRRTLEFFEAAKSEGG